MRDLIQVSMRKVRITAKLVPSVLMRIIRRVDAEERLPADHPARQVTGQNRNIANLHAKVGGKCVPEWKSF